MTFHAKLTATPILVSSGRSTENVLQVDAFCRGVILVMRRPARVINRAGARAVRWRVSAEMLTPASTYGETGSDVLTLLNPSPGADDPDGSAPRTLLVGPISNDRRPVAVAFWPLMTRGMRFDFRSNKPEDPDAMADVWAIPFTAFYPQIKIGFHAMPDDGVGVVRGDR